ncbi:hypothetical protein RUND412_010468 [Rhizina undulata]
MSIPFNQIPHNELLRRNHNLDPGVMQQVLTAMSKFPLEWQYFPTSGEFYPNADVALSHLDAAAFCSGFAVVISGGSADLSQLERKPPRVSRVEYTCIHHSQPANCNKPKGQLEQTGTTISQKEFQEMRANGQHIDLNKKLYISVR